MPLYRNPDFQRLPSGLACLFDKAADDSFFALPAWFDLMTRDERAILEKIAPRIFRTLRRNAIAEAVVR